MLKCWHELSTQSSLIVAHFPFPTNSLSRTFSRKTLRCLLSSASDMRHSLFTSNQGYIGSLPIPTLPTSLFPVHYNLQQHGIELCLSLLPCLSLCYETEARKMEILTVFITTKSFVHKVLPGTSQVLSTYFCTCMNKYSNNPAPL